MATIDIRRVGLACGSTAALLYLGCVFVMATVSRDAQVLFFDSLLQGIDSNALLRTTMPVRTRSRASSKHLCSRG